MYVDWISDRSWRLQMTQGCRKVYKTIMRFLDLDPGQQQKMTILGWICSVNRIAMFWNAISQKEKIWLVTEKLKSNGYSIRGTQII